MNSKHKSPLPVFIKAHKIPGDVPTRGVPEIISFDMKEQHQSLDFLHGHYYFSTQPASKFIHFCHLVLTFKQWRLVIMADGAVHTLEKRRKGGNIKK